MFFRKKIIFPLETIIFIGLFLVMSILFSVSSALQFQKMNELRYDIISLAKEVVSLKQTSISQEVVEKGIEATIGIFGIPLSPRIPSSAPQFLGSGVMVRSADGKISILSNYHVIAQSSQLQGKTFNGANIDLEVLSSNAEQDIAFLACKTSCPGIDPLSVASKSKAGDPVLGIGFHETIPHLFFGHILSSEYMNNPAGIVLNFLIHPGDSGGPVINSYGELIGIQQGFSLDEKISFAIPSWNIL